MIILNFPIGKRTQTDSNLLPEVSLKSRYEIIDCTLSRYC